MSPDLQVLFDMISIITEARKLETWLVFKAFHNTNYKEQNHGNLNQQFETSFISFLNKESNLKLMPLVQNKRKKNSSFFYSYYQSFDSAVRPLISYSMPIHHAN